MTQSGFRAFHASLVARRALRMSALRVSLRHEAVRLVDRRGARALISRCASTPGQYRLTYFDDRGPTGHICFSSLDEALRDAAAGGWLPAWAWEWDGLMPDALTAQNTTPTNAGALVA